MPGIRWSPHLVSKIHKKGRQIKLPAVDNVVFVCILRL